MTDAECASLKLRASSLKARGLSLMSEFDSERYFDGIVSLREAARIEASLASCIELATNLRLFAAIEECGCYVDARSPRWAEVAWRRMAPVLGAAGYEHPALERIAPKFAAQQQSFREGLAKSPELSSRTETGTFLGSPGKQRVLRRELRQLLVNFAGEDFLWFAQYRAHETFDPAIQFELLSRVARLVPHDPRVRGMLFNSMSEIPALRIEFGQFMDQIFENRDNEGFEVLMLLALSIIRIARVDKEHRLWHLSNAQVLVELTRARGVAVFDRDLHRRVDFLLRCAVEQREPRAAELIDYGIVEPGSIEDTEIDPTLLVTSSLRASIDRTPVAHLLAVG